MYVNMGYMGSYMGCGGAITWDVGCSLETHLFGLVSLYGCIWLLLLTDLALMRMWRGGVHWHRVLLKVHLILPPPLPEYVVVMVTTDSRGSQVTTCS